MVWLPSSCGAYGSNNALLFKEHQIFKNVEGHIHTHATLIYACYYENNHQPMIYATTKDVKIILHPSYVTVSQQFAFIMMVAF